MQNDDIFTQRNLDAVGYYLRDIEGRMARDLQRLKAAEFPANHTWFNSAPLSFERDLKGKLVLIDFWTYCCINCLHVLPDHEYLE